MPKVVFVNEKKEIEVPAGANLREEAKKAGVNVYWGLSRYLNCFGHGTCLARHIGTKFLLPQQVQDVLGKFPRLVCR